jgi:hypothetical protein
VQSQSDWELDAVKYALLSLVWFLNIIVGAVYLVRRYEALRASD